MRIVAMQNLKTLLIGVYFGIVLIKSEVVSWFRIQKMFRFEEAHMYLIIASAIAVGALSVFLIRKLHAKTVGGENIQIKEKKFQKGMIIGGILFGLGWAITGACPGPIYAQIGSGELLALLTFAGAFAGAYLYAYLHPRLPH
jgi:uncharacterized membrane protein YedE/YeeE